MQQAYTAAFIKCRVSDKRPVSNKRWEFWDVYLGFTVFVLRPWQTSKKMVWETGIRKIVPTANSFWYQFSGSKIAATRNKHGRWKQAEINTIAADCFIAVTNNWRWNVKRYLNTHYFQSILPRISFVHASWFFQRPGAIQAIYLHVLTYLYS